jgi:hypothetical protein
MEYPLYFQLEKLLLNVKWILDGTGTTLFTVSDFGSIKNRTKY